MSELNCPNCITSWKCNGPHLEKKSDVHYLSDRGYYIFSENKKWIFVPFEKEFDKDALLEIIKILDYLNN